MNKKIMPARLVIVMGVSGCGKSTVAKKLATLWGYRMLDGDDFHTPEAKARMAQQMPLTDDDRKPWITRMLSYIAQHAKTQGIVLAYSGLRQSHRQQFRALGIECEFIFLNGKQQIIEERIKLRQQHFFPASLVASQFEALELPQQDERDIASFDINMSLAALCDSIAHHYQAKEANNEITLGIT